MFVIRRLATSAQALMRNRHRSTGSNGVTFAISKSIAQWMRGRTIIDLRSLRNEVEEVYSALSRGHTKVDASSFAVILHSLVQFDLFGSYTADMLERTIEQHVNDLNACDLVLLLESCAKLRDEISPHSIAAIWMRLESEEMLHSLKAGGDLGTLCRLIDVMACTGYISTNLFREVAEGLTPHILSLSSKDILSVVKVMHALQLRHKKLTDTIILVLPIIRCSDKELEEISSCLVTMGAGTVEDRDYLNRLVSFRLSFIPD